MRRVLPCVSYPSIYRSEWAILQSEILYQRMPIVNCPVSMVVGQLLAASFSPFGLDMQPFLQGGFVLRPLAIPASALPEIVDLPPVS